MASKKIGICDMESFDSRPFNSVGSSRIRARWLLNYWPEAEQFVTGKKYSVILFQKVYWDKMMREFEGMKILDICDPDWLEGKPVFEYVDLADAVVTSTETLAEYMRKLRPEALIKCIPDRVYIPDHKPIKARHEGPLRKVCWFGYSHVTHYLLPTFDELVSRGITLTVISNNPYEVPLAYRGRLKLNNVPYDYGTIFREIVRHDAVLMPPPSGDERARYKSNNKTIQAKAQGMPVIVLPQDLDRLNDPKEREKASKEGIEEVARDFDVRQSVVEYKELIEEIKDRKG